MRRLFGSPAGGESWRRRRGLVTISAILVPSLLLGLVVAVAATGGVRVYRPSVSLCTGVPLKVGVRYRAGTSTSRSYRIGVFNPGGTKVWSRRGNAAARWKYWSVPTSATGVFRTVYRTAERKKVYTTSVVSCEEAPPASPSPVADKPKVELTSDDGGLAMFFLEGVAPGDPPATSCLQVSYTGSVPVTVRLYGMTTGTGLDPYLDLTLTRGTLPALTAGSCSGFAPDTANHIGAGPGVIYRGSLRDYPDEYSGGLVDREAGGPEWWADGERHAYRFQISMRDDNAAQGRTAGQTFVWEARSS
ncbi:MAG TPA: hypothetical protein VFH75_07665 [Actinomycetota bacterium]|nr:hypothetical protein [Actinomycetota bacterium]